MLRDPVVCSEVRVANTISPDARHHMMINAGRSGVEYENRGARAEEHAWDAPHVLLAHSPATDFVPRFGSDQPARATATHGVRSAGDQAIAFAQSLEEHPNESKDEPASPNEMLAPCPGQDRLP